MALLVADVGSSQTKLGLFSDRELHLRDRFDTERGWKPEEWGSALSGFLVQAGVAPEALRGVAVACVVAAAEPALRGGCRERLGHEPEFIGPDLGSPLPLRYDPPRSLGADRIANAVAAHARYGAPVLVVDVGTAVTFDAVAADGGIVGGAILSGPRTSLEALRRLAPQLPAVGPGRPEAVIGRSTLACLQVGAYYGLLGQVEGIARRMKDALGKTMPVVATGGFAPLLAEEPGIVDHVDVDLTLTGIRIIWDLSHSSR